MTTTANDSLSVWAKWVILFTWETQTHLHLRFTFVYEECKQRCETKLNLIYFREFSSSLTTKIDTQYCWRSEHKQISDMFPIHL